MPNYDSSLRNQSSGLFNRNPTHILEADNAEYQSDIVKSIKKSGVKRMQIRHTYDNIDPSAPPPLAGILKIREMDQRRAVAFCKNLMRTRPNIFQLHIKLGNYPSQRRLDNGKIRLLDSQKPRFNTEIGEKLGDVISDKQLNVTEIRYIVHNADPGYFSATAEVYGTTLEEYENDEFFSPEIAFDFIKTS